MPTQLNYNTSVDKNTDVALIVGAGEAGSLAELSSEEASYVTQQVENEAKLISLNRYTQRVYLLITSEAKTESAARETLRQAGYTLLKQLKADKVQTLAIKDYTGSQASLYLAEGLFLSNYQFQGYKTKNHKPHQLQTITIADTNVSEKEVQELQHVLEAVYKTRDLVNQPNSHQSATQLSEQLDEMASEAGFMAESLDELRIMALKMGGLLAVNQGSEEPPTFNILEWKPENAKNQQPYILVGKGVVYDTGGLSLKPTPQSMDYMKSDMAGAATVAGVMYALAKNQVPLHVIALIPATDNRPGGKAYAPGDVITMHNGTTVEVLNTDAEGRLILADALSFAQKYNPQLVIDFATLTGSAMRAVGKEGLVAMGTAGEEVMNGLKQTGEAVYERIVEFPLWDEYKKQLESDIADLKNIGGADAGHITAGKFLEAFTSYPWVHFDIAGTAYLHSEDSYRGKLATGSGLRLVYNYLRSLAN
ncbi:M17 family metallopeptidase [Pontibacter sp. SGAir0037]|uniref:leucyl aminopeptidase family protein n=1 Tax=Pontibacter sp. SGAir0037 TaxID=2571030 RepID=UPI0010CD49DB|nr:leucyl aminopeptidase [Pontibacter sp. SGAir0037]QCR22635.1 peptidase M17 [Pontibacter sp. SGAir0037]